MISSSTREQVEVRPVTAIEAVGAGLLVLLAVLFFLREGLPAGTAPVSVDPLYANPAEVPFAEVRPEGFRPHNPYLSDHALVFDPWLRFMNRAVRDGEIPWWSPHSGGGVPFVGNLSSAFFFPTTWLCLLPTDVMTVERGMLWGAVFRLWLAGFFGYLFLRRLGLGRVGACTGAIGLTFFGYQVVWLFYSLSNVACMIPLSLWLADRFASRPTAGRTVALGVGMAVQFLGGHAETSVALAIAVTAWCVARGTAPERTAPIATTAWRYALAGLLAVALCAFQILPFAEYLAVSQGRWERTVAEQPEFSPWLRLASTEGALVAVVAALLAWGTYRLLPRDPERTGWGRAALGGLLLGLFFLPLLQLGLRPQLALALAPDLFGSPFTEGYRGPETYTDVSGGYVGALMLLLAFAYVVFGLRRRVAVTFGGLAAFAWLLPAHVEPFYSLLKAIPPFDLAANTRMLPLAGVGVSVLAACAVDELARTARSRWAAGIPRVLVACGVAAAVVTPAASFWFGVADAGRLGAFTSLVNPAVFEPELLPRGDARLVVPLRLYFPSEVSAVRVEVGGATIFDGPPKDRAVATEWDATRADAGWYSVVTHATQPDGSELVEEQRAVGIDRSPSIPLGGLLRIGAAIVLLLLLARFVGAAPWLALLVPLFVAGELVRFGGGYNAFVPERQVFPETSVTRAVRAELDARAAAGDGPFRVWAEDVILQPNMHYAYDLQTARSYDQLEIRTFNQWMTWVNGGPVPFTQWNHRTVDYRAPLFDVTNIGYVITAERLDDIEGFTLVHEAGEGGRFGRLYRNESALPRAFLASAAVDIRPALEEGRVADLLALDPRTTAFLEAPAPAGLGGTGTVRCVRYGLHEVELDVRSDGPAMLVLTDNWYPGWRASVQGEDRPIARSHLTFRAVPVPAGASRVVFRYRPWSVRLGFALAVLGLGLAGGAVVRARGSRRRLSDPPL